MIQLWSSDMIGAFCSLWVWTHLCIKRVGVRYQAGVGPSCVERPGSPASSQSPETCRLIGDSKLSVHVNGCLSLQPWSDWQPKLDFLARADWIQIDFRKSEQQKTTWNLIFANHIQSTLQRGLKSNLYRCVFSPDALLIQIGYQSVLSVTSRALGTWSVLMGARRPQSLTNVPQHII